MWRRWSPAIIAAGKPVIIRVLWNEPGLVGQALDVGAAASSRRWSTRRRRPQALVKAAKYPPLGMRSWGGYAAVQAAGVVPADYLAEANEGTLVFAMIETQEALDNLDAIAATPGLDGLFVGPNDLGDLAGLWASASRSHDARSSTRRSKTVAAAAKKNELDRPAPSAAAGAIAQYFAERGFSFIVGGDRCRTAGGRRQGHAGTQPSGI